MMQMLTFFVSFGIPSGGSVVSHAVALNCLFKQWPMHWLLVKVQQDKWEESPEHVHLFVNWMHTHSHTLSHSRKSRRTDNTNPRVKAERKSCRIFSFFSYSASHCLYVPCSMSVSFVSVVVLVVCTACAMEQRTMYGYTLYLNTCWTCYGTDKWRCIMYIIIVSILVILYVVSAPTFRRSSHRLTKRERKWRRRRSRDREREKSNANELCNMHERLCMDKEIHANSQNSLSTLQQWNDIFHKIESQRREIRKLNGRNDKTDCARCVCKWKWKWMCCINSNYSCDFMYSTHARSSADAVHCSRMVHDGTQYVWARIPYQFHLCMCACKCEYTLPFICAAEQHKRIVHVAQNTWCAYTPLTQ